MMLTNLCGAGRRRALVLAWVALAGAVSSAATGPGKQRAVLRGVVIDAVTGAAVPDARVRLGKREQVAGTGAFRLRAKSRNAQRTVFEAPGYQRFESWTLPGVRQRRVIPLLPEGRVRLPGYDHDLAVEQVLEHFNAVYRDAYEGQFPAGLSRWVRQPRFLMFERVLVPEERDGERVWVAGPRVRERQRDRLAALLAEYVPLLTGDAYHGDELQVAPLAVGALVGADAFWQDGAVTVAVLDLPSRSAGGGALTLNGAITAGSVTLRPYHLANSSGRVEVHEIGHALGMRHGFHGLPSPSVPLCSVMGNYECDFRGFVSEIDVLMARIAYSRGPGNDHSDRDPRPAS